MQAGPDKKKTGRRRGSLGHWSTRYKGVTPNALRRSFLSNLEYSLAKDEFTWTSHDEFLSLACTIRERLIERWILTQQQYHRRNVKRVNYFSLEYLPGRLLESNALNLGLRDACRTVCARQGMSLEEILGQEPDQGLGNGGLGRLASCFMDSMATLQLPSIGYGIRYQYGIFKQLIKDHVQHEVPEGWLRFGNPWEIERPEYRFTIRFYGRTVHPRGSTHRAPTQWLDPEIVIAVPYDTPVSGYRNDTVNTLRLWSAHSTNELDLQDFNRGDYIGACEKHLTSETISKVLYPSDNTQAGKELRLKQQFFFTSASLQDIIRRFRKDNGDDFSRFSGKTAIHLNETHPAIAIPELMRLLVDEYLIDWDTAWKTVTEVFAYTNHTLMPEALEKWPVPLIQRLLPRHMEIIFEINQAFLELVSRRLGGDPDLMRRMSIIEEGSDKFVRMAHLAIVGSHSVNGVANLHTELLKSGLFGDFHRLWPAKIRNKTNGITPRRWLYKCNTSLSALITKAVGEGWTTDLSRLEGLCALKDDAAFQRRWRAARRRNKIRLAEELLKRDGISLNPETLIDVQIKRIHEYKRQLLNIFGCIADYNALRSGKAPKYVPRTVLIAGKAAPGYAAAKLIIELIGNVSAVINEDRRCADKLKVHFVPNYCVTLAEFIIPAADLSQQISTAGTEASGTGNMKLALNGALTIGTLDGATVEMRDRIGEQNMFIFGLTADQVQQSRQRGYDPRSRYETCAPLKEAIDMVGSGYFSPEEPRRFAPIVDSLLEGGDPFMIMADFQSYLDCRKRVQRAYRDRRAWAEMSILNTARMGWFSSDRAVGQYAEDVWKVGPEQAA